MTTLLNVPITAAIGTPLVSPTFQIENPAVLNLGVLFDFTYTSGGASVDAYLQTSFDGGTTWMDIAQMHAATVALLEAYNLSSITPKTTAVVPSDGSLAANTSVDGLLGPIYRVKYKSSGTYVGANLRVDVAAAARLQD